MQTLDGPAVDMPRPLNDFTIELGVDGAANMLQFRGRPIVAMDGQRVEAQFGFGEQGTLVLVSDNTQFKELLTIVLIGPDLRERDRVLVGGAYPQGFLAYAERHDTDEIAFCWHDLDLIVVVRRYWSWFKLRRRWLRLRDTIPQQPARIAEPTR